MLARSPDLADRISAVLSERHAALGAHAAAEDVRKSDPRESRELILAKIRRFFSL